MGTPNIHKTSIIPAGGHIEPIRSHKTIATSGQIELLHIAVFITVLFSIFGGLWKAASKKSTVTVGSLAEAKAKA